MSIIIAFTLSFLALFLEIIYTPLAQKSYSGVYFTFKFLILIDMI